MESTFCYTFKKFGNQNKDTQVSNFVQKIILYQHLAQSGRPFHCKACLKSSYSREWKIYLIKNSTFGDWGENLDGFLLSTVDVIGNKGQGSGVSRE